MKRFRIQLMWILAWLAVPPAQAQVPLPTSWTGPWERGYPPAGWVFHGLGVDRNPDYDGLLDGAAFLQNTGSSISIHYDGPAASVSYWIRGLTFSGGVFRVEQSVDGLEWTTLHSYADPPATASHHTRVPSAQARHIRFLYAEKVTGNVGLDGISIASGAFVQPRIGALGRSGGAVTVTIEETVALRSYVLERTEAIQAGPPVDWTQADQGTGTGGALELHDAAPAPSVRFYRVRDATP